MDISLDNIGTSSYLEVRWTTPEGNGSSSERYHHRNLNHAAERTNALRAEGKAAKLVSVNVVELNV